MANEIPAPPPDGIVPDASQTSPEDSSITNPSAYFLQQYNRAWNLLRMYDTNTRLKKLRTLQSRGYDPGIPVSVNGLDDSDIKRYAAFLVYAGISNQPPWKAMETVEKLKPLPTSGQTRMRTPASDVDAVFDGVMRDRLGRGATAAEKEKFRNSYYGMEAGMNPPSISSAAGEQVTSANAEESEAAKFAGFAATFEQMLRGA